MAPGRLSRLVPSLYARLQTRLVMGGMIRRARPRVSSARS